MVSCTKVVGVLLIELRETPRKIYTLRSWERGRIGFSNELSLALLITFNVEVIEGRGGVPKLPGWTSVSRGRTPKVVTVVPPDTDGRGFGPKGGATRTESPIPPGLTDWGGRGFPTPGGRGTDMLPSTSLWCPNPPGPKATRTGVSRGPGATVFGPRFPTLPSSPLPRTLRPTSPGPPLTLPPLTRDPQGLGTFPTGRVRATTEEKALPVTVGVTLRLLTDKLPMLTLWGGRTCTRTLGDLGPFLSPPTLLLLPASTETQCHTGVGTRGPSKVGLLVVICPQLLRPEVGSHYPTVVINYTPHRKPEERFSTSLSPEFGGRDSERRYLIKGIVSRGVSPFSRTLRGNLCLLSNPPMSLPCQIPLSPQSSVTPQT